MIQAKKIDPLLNPSVKQELLNSAFPTLIDAPTSRNTKPRYKQESMEVGD